MASQALNLSEQFNAGGPGQPYPLPNDPHNPNPESPPSSPDVRPQPPDLPPLPDFEPLPSPVVPPA